ncbi:MAG: glycosyltransferase family 4 protein [Candidatus Bathyarchaeia archaeon]|jgi:glycosyltransferase involved in cell wall biosynthesis
MRKPTVVIVKTYPWKSSHLLKDHPEYSAIFKIVERYSSSVNFVVTGVSKEPICHFRVNDNLTAWDIPCNGPIGFFTYYLQLFRIFIQSRPRLIIVLGLPAIVPALASTLFSLKSKCIPVFYFDDWSYHGQKTAGNFLLQLQLKVIAVALWISRIKMPYMFALSRSVRDNIESLAPNLRGRISLIAYPISKAFLSAKGKSALAVEEPTILTVAGIEQRKGLDVLVKAISIIPNELKPNVIIKGEVRDPVYLQQLNRLIATLNLRDKITFVTNFIDYDALLSFYHSATLFVFPTREDALGVVVLEAIHSGVPVIATSVGGIPDMIENGVNGILVKPDDPKELAGAIQMLLKDKALRSNFAERAVKILNDRYYSRTTLEEALEKSIKTVVE